MAKRFYTVKSGESLSIIARDELGDIARWREIAYINSLSAPYVIQTGQTILLPVDDYPLQVTVTEGVPQPTDGAAVTTGAAFELTPTTLAVFGLAAVAVFLFLQESK
jgi:LysM repeat protein